MARTAARAAQRRTLSPIDAPQTAVLIANQLREKVLDGSFGPGEQLSEASLAGQLEVSRGPVREALQRLSQEGLLVSHRNRGVFVVELSADDVAEIYAARDAVETAAAQTVFGFPKTRKRAAVATLSKIVDGMPALIASGDWARVAKQDLAFHQALVDATGNSRLVRIYSTLAAESRMCMVHLANAYNRPHVLADEHRHLVDLLDSGALPELEAAIHEHMDTAVRDLTALMQQRDGGVL
ncbi:GntR family transcriptional regulator [Rhodococcus rhodnii]|uniref:GntR family transcriptional regulator n=2 Tax=Rhodococcus rhodnii TaxID=38312 RepID=R7WI63_9NOCA|nr:GntR family transcriptional regulator [Rhodococcus rhodnii]EOM74858.1 GntR family transcriptional regulator [Rhodococcus rhodnii LMG 5362]TXG91686.1 GntR family transcriptional regulator [Rhodococcus rhodnii]